MNISNTKDGNGGEVISISDGLKMVMPPSPYWPESANVYVFKDNDGISLFDVGCGNIMMVDRLWKALKILGWDMLPMKKVILSHIHPDHAGAMEMILSEFNPKEIIIHEKDLVYCQQPEKLHFSFDIPICEKRRIEAIEGSQMPGPDRAGERPPGDDPKRFNLLGYFNSCKCSVCRFKPTKLLKEGDFIHIGNYSFCVVHTPGHAPGHMSLYDSKKFLLLAGDIIGDVVAWYSPSSGGATGYLKSIEKIEALKIDQILPSHGGRIIQVQEAIKSTKQTILGRDKTIIDALINGPKTYHELLNILFSTPEKQFFPGTAILECHIEKLKNEQKIRKIDSNSYVSLQN